MSKTCEAFHSNGVECTDVDQVDQETFDSLLMHFRVHIYIYIWSRVAYWYTYIHISHVSSPIKCYTRATMPPVQHPPPHHHGRGGSGVPCTGGGCNAVPYICILYGVYNNKSSTSISIESIYSMFVLLYDVWEI